MDDKKVNKDFSFSQLREELTNPARFHNVKPSEEQEAPRLKFEPNLNITRMHGIGNHERIQKIDKNEAKTELIDQLNQRFNIDDSKFVKKAAQKRDKKKFTLNEILIKPRTIVNEEKLGEETHKEASRMKEVIEKMKEKDPSAYLPTILPFEHEQKSHEESLLQEIYDEQGFKENDLFLMQFPRMLPMNVDLLKKMKRDELEDDENLNDNTVMGKQEFENVFKTIPKNSSLGKLKIYKSGRVKLHIGDNLFDLSSGVTSNFAQELGVFSPNTKEAFFLGKVKEKKIVVTPQLD